MTLIRQAIPADAEAVAALLRQLGHANAAEDVTRQLARLEATGSDAVYVAERDGRVVAVMGLHWAPLLHRPKPLGRITVLVVDESVRGQGVGSALVEHALRVLREAGCGALEVTSNVRRAEAHAFYRRRGFDSPSAYFRRML